MKQNNSAISACLILVLTALCGQAQPFHSMVPLTGFGPSGNGEMLADGSIPFLTAGTVQRGLARNPSTGNLIFVDRGVPGQGADVSGAIYVLGGATGAVMNSLNTNGIQGGGFAHYAPGVADDGTVYVANVVLSTNATITTYEPFKVYRWASENSTDAPTIAFNAVLGTNNFRWGNSIDVRGSGANTEILVSSDGTESALLTTTDGVNFSATILSADFTATLQGSLGFGIGDTYWAKFRGQPLRLMSFDRIGGTATTSRQFGTGNIPEITAHEMIGTDPENHLLASVDYLGADPDQVNLYDISNTNDVPQFLESRVLTTINNGQAGSPRGYITVGGGKLYVHNINNGIYGFDLVDGAFPDPIILTQPASKQLLAGSTAAFRVIAQRGRAFQWKKGATALTGETNSILTLTNIQQSDAAAYSVVVSNSTSSVTSSDATLTVLSIEDFYRLTPLWSTAPNAQPYFSITGGSGNTPNQRSMAYNSASNHLYVVSRAGSATAIFNVYVVDADTGLQLYTLNTNGSTFTGFAGQIGLVSIDVADDGSIYACNVDSSGAWKLYRWADGNSNTVPALVFDGDPFGSPTTTRWGDVMDVRGGGINTQIVMDGQQLASPFFAIFQPTDASLTSFGPVVFSSTATTGPVGRSLQFGTGDTIWQKRNNSFLIHSEFDLDAPFSAAPLLGSHTNFPSTITHVALDESKNLLGAINNSGVAGVSPYQVELYDISNIDAPVLLSQRNFPENKRANADIGKVVFGGDKMFALNAQNGVVAFRLDIGALAAPTLNVTRTGGDVVLTWEGSDFVLEAKTDLGSPTWDTISYQAGSPNTATETISGQTKFYRLRK